MAADEELQLTLQLRNEFSDELKRMIGQINQLEAALRDATNGTSGASAQDVERLSRELGQAQDNAKTLSAATDKLDRHIDELGSSADHAGDKMNRMSAAGSKTKKGFSGLIAAGKGAAMGITAVAAATAAAAIGFGKLNTMVGQYQQNVIKSRAVFGRQTREMRKWAKGHADDFGSSTQDVMNYAAGLQDLFVPMGFARKQATGMTKDMAGLVPVLTAWDRKGRSAAEITDILSAAVTGERESLKSLGITISQDAVDSQIQLMRSHGKLKGATDEQAQAQATLALVFQKSGDAQKSYAANQDTISRRTKTFSSQVANLRDQGLKTLVGVWNRVSDAFEGSDLGSPVKSLSRIIRRNRDDIIGFMMRGAGWVFRFASAWAKYESIVLSAIGHSVGAFANFLDVLAFFNPKMRGVANGAHAIADGLVAASKTADDASTKSKNLAESFFQQADAAHSAQRGADAYRAALKGVNKEQKKFLEQYKGTSLFTGYSSYRDPGDTRSPMGAGPSLGPGGLAAAHAGYASALGGHTITSGIRAWGLGSANSDHLRGRAMDVKGPRLGSYAQAVRAAGGYAAFHGAGAERHLHVVPRTNRPAPDVMAGGDTFHSELHFHGSDVRPFDVRSAVISANRDLARRRRERGGR